MNNIGFSLSQPPKKAIEWLQKKGITTQNYKTLTESELAKVVTIARMTDLDMLQSIKNALIESAQNGTPYVQFKRDVLNIMQSAGWLHKNDAGDKEIIDTNTGEIFGSPRRLENIYRTNMQTAYMAGQYQRLMQNIDNRPYWQYNAVGDARTRPMHAVMSGLIYRFDDPFWSTFYPPNGYRCRCSVTALADRDLARQGLKLSATNDDNFIEIEKPYNKRGETYTTKAYKTHDGTLITTDKGFSYNAGRMNYRPDLDIYDKALAQQFAKTDMSGAEFRACLKQLQIEFEQVKKRQGIDDKISTSDKIMLRNTLARNLKFAAGLLSDESCALLKSKRATVWLSDDTLIKQVDSRVNQDFDQYYADLPDVINEPDQIFQDKNNFTLVKQKNDKNLLVVIKYLNNENEIFVQSYRLTNTKEIAKLDEKLITLK